MSRGRPRLDPEAVVGVRYLDPASGPNCGTLARVLRETVRKELGDAAVGGQVHDEEVAGAGAPHPIGDLLADVDARRRSDLQLHLSRVGVAQCVFRVGLRVAAGRAVARHLAHQELPIHLQRGGEARLAVARMAIAIGRGLFAHVVEELRVDHLSVAVAVGEAFGDAAHEAAREDALRIERLAVLERELQRRHRRPGNEIAARLDEARITLPRGGGAAGERGLEHGAPAEVARVGAEEGAHVALVGLGRSARARHGSRVTGIHDQVRLSVAELIEQGTHLVVSNQVRDLHGAGLARHDPRVLRHQHFVVAVPLVAVVVELEVAVSRIVEQRPCAGMGALHQPLPDCRENALSGCFPVDQRADVLGLESEMFRQQPVHVACVAHRTAKVLDAGVGIEIYADDEGAVARARHRARRLGGLRRLCFARIECDLLLLGSYIGDRLRRRGCRWGFRLRRLGESESGAGFHPRREGAHVGVHPVLAGLGAARPPAHHARLHPGVAVGHHQRPSAVSLAGVLPAPAKPGTESAVVDGFPRIGVEAGPLVHQRKLHFHEAGSEDIGFLHRAPGQIVHEVTDASPAGVAFEGIRLRAGLAAQRVQQPPPDRRRRGARSGDRCDPPRVGQRHRRHPGRPGQLEQCDVVLGAVRRVAFVRVNGLHVDSAPAPIEVVGTDQYLDVLRGEGIHAVRGGEHPAGRDHRAPAELLPLPGRLARLDQRHAPGPPAGIGGQSADDASELLGGGAGGDLLGGDGHRADHCQEHRAAKRRGRAVR